MSEFTPTDDMIESLYEMTLREHRGEEERRVLGFQATGSTRLVMLCPVRGYSNIYLMVLTGEEQASII